MQMSETNNNLTPEQFREYAKDCMNSITGYVAYDAEDDSYLLFGCSMSHYPNVKIPNEMIESIQLDQTMVCRGTGNLHDVYKACVVLKPAQTDEGKVMQQLLAEMTAGFSHEQDEQTGMGMNQHGREENPSLGSYFAFGRLRFRMFRGMFNRSWFGRLG
jgi:hypothetical protein